jgi:hypothetical protein
MWGQASGPVSAKNIPFSEVLNSNTVDFKQILYYKKRVPRGGPWLGLVVVGHYNCLINSNNQVKHKLSTQGSLLFQR